MKLHKYLFLTVSILPSYVMAWSSPGEPFSGELKINGEVKSSRNPWVWKLGGGKDDLTVKTSKVDARNREKVIPLALPELTVLLGKTTFSSPAGREGLAPRITYGGGEKDFSLNWISPGLAEVKLPVKGGDGTQIGRLSFKMQAMAVLRHSYSGKHNYVNLYNNLNSNGLPGNSHLTPSAKIPGILENLFNGEGPHWLQQINITESWGITRFNDSSLRLVEGVYGAQIVPNSVELSLREQLPTNWHVSLPVNIEYH
ncbi:fimbrial protein [Cronobacter dublinensis]|uniref:F4 family fimbrial subunit n=1 Tax=Cronobacter dublinensis TaxID=413497 RepID=UPI0024C27923|nr:fimbrial protein [Cronobacter dublinensis]MDK1191348.1 fimbrial protein [Cronobacter dublinensis]MDK1201987.1 fimbrial protein [Cronobacter dublinensis]HDI3023708.1 fimbrial protein [Cronobacter turicensis]